MKELTRFYRTGRLEGAGAADRSRPVPFPRATYVELTDWRAIAQHPTIVPGASAIAARRARHGIARAASSRSPQLQEAHGPDRRDLPRFQPTAVNLFWAVTHDGRYERTEGNVVDIKDAMVHEAVRCSPKTSKRTAPWPPRRELLESAIPCSPIATPARSQQLDSAPRWASFGGHRGWKADQGLLPMNAARLQHETHRLELHRTTSLTIIADTMAQFSCKRKIDCASSGGPIAATEIPPTRSVLTTCAAVQLSQVPCYVAPIFRPST